MFSQDWRTSERKHDVIEEPDVVIPVDEDINLVGHLFRPDTDEPVPLLVGAHPYNTEDQYAQMKPKSIGPQVAWIEAGDPYFYARRGYSHIILNVRGTGKSDGQFRNLDNLETQDVANAIEWLGDQSWCDGNVGMYGVSYFGMIQLKVAMEAPNHLKAIFAPWAMSEPYRDLYYHGGILAHEFAKEWGDHIDNPRCYSWSEENMTEAELAQAIDKATGDDEIYAEEPLVEALTNLDQHTNPLLADVILNNLYNEYYKERGVSFENTSIPAYLGAGWGHYAIHLSAAFRNWKRWEGPKKLLIGPDRYLDRPLYQLQYESLRWFDYWLKGQENEIMDEPPIRLYQMHTGEWKKAEKWPLPETRWTPFYLHEDNLLMERDYWPNEGQSTFEEGPYRHESVEFRTPKIVEKTEVMGPSLLKLFASTTDEEVLFFVQLYRIEEDDNEIELSRGWLRGSQRKIDDDRSEPWKVYHPHDEREPLKPDEIYEFHINIVESGFVLQPGERLGIRISGADVGGGWGDIAGDDIMWKQALATGHLSKQNVSRITLYHNDTYPSRLLVPVTDGNYLGTFYSGGEPTPEYGELPYRKVKQPKSVED